MLDKCIQLYRMRIVNTNEQLRYHFYVDGATDLDNRNSTRTKKKNCIIVNRQLFLDIYISSLSEVYEKQKDIFKHASKHNGPFIQFYVLIQFYVSRRVTLLL